MGPRIFPRSEHSISRSQISEHSLRVLYRLKGAGFEAYLVGGCVRDLLLGRKPKDFDVVTNARPEQIRGLFKNCRLIGRRFRLAHVYYGEEVVEVATFRAASDRAEQSGDRVVRDGMILRDNAFGTIEEDIWRRDFTVNALYYNIQDFSVVDYCGGMDDHRSRTLRLIGDPVHRYREDPVRMLRAVRFATKLEFHIHPSCREPLPNLASLLRDVPAARLYEEVIKLLLGGQGCAAFDALSELGLFEVLFPGVARIWKTVDAPNLSFIRKVLQSTDTRLNEGKPVTSYFLFSALLWEPVRRAADRLIAQGVPDIAAYQQASGEVIDEQVRRIAIPKSVTLPMRDLWCLQPRFDKRSGARPSRLLTHPRYKAAYDFLVLRAESGDVDAELSDWWTRFNAADDNEQRLMTQPGERRRGRRGRRGRRNGRANSSSTETSV